MKIVIIPSHNQSENIEKIIRAYENQTVLPDLVLFVLDRCSDNSLDVLENVSTSLVLKWIVKDFGENFSAGMTRDFGITYVEENFPNYSMIIFTDGDCVPSKELVNLHFANCKSRTPTVSCGRRVMQNIFKEWEEDERLCKNWINEFTFGDTNGRLLVSNALTLDNIFTYSCNLAFNKLSIELCKNVNSCLESPGRVFHKSFDGSWGGEDNFISHILYRTGNHILMTSNDCYVKHYWHPEESKKDVTKKRLICQKLSRKLEDLILNGMIEGPIQNIVKRRYVFFGNGDEKNDLKNLDYVEGIDCRISNIIENVCEKLDIKKYEQILKYFLVKNSRTTYSENGKYDITDSDIIYYKEFLGYMKFYLKDDEIVFEDDLEKFKKISFNGSFLKYC